QNPSSPPINEQQNLPIPPPQGNQLIPNRTTKPTRLLTAIAPQKCRGERVGQGGFCRKVIGGSINFVPKPAPTLDFLSRYSGKGCINTPCYR
ncbi:MAG: hypothetical protein ACLFT9_23285, partial [Coleofasciculus sp.]